MTSSNVTVDRLAELADDLWNVATYRMFPTIGESVVWAAYTVLVAFHCTIHYRQNPEDRVWPVFAVSASSYIGCTLIWALDVVILWQETDQLLPSRLSVSASESTIGEALKDVTGTTSMVRDTFQVFVFLLCDIISLWRAYVIYGRPMWLKVVCIILVVGADAMWILQQLAHCAASYLKNPPMSLMRLYEVNDGILGTAGPGIAGAISGSAQVFATILIARKAWIHRREVVTLLPDRKGSPYHGRLLAVLYIVIETGVVYACLWGIFNLAIESQFSDTGFYWAQYWMCQIAGIYPTLIVVVISLRTSLLERSVNDPELVKLSMRFATHHDSETSPSDNTPVHARVEDTGSDRDAERENNVQAPV
ncbi:unnamed protein product [Peniophora sp. CBMAI 1063]|nr:unnamed protein product [Peniophora sp. CBMAI 1063]